MGPDGVRSTLIKPDDSRNSISCRRSLRYRSNRETCCWSIVYVYVSCFPTHSTYERETASRHAPKSYGRINLKLSVSRSAKSRTQSDKLIALTLWEMLFRHFCLLLSFFWFLFCPQRRHEYDDCFFFPFHLPSDNFDNVLLHYSIDSKIKYFII